ncbi:MAG TPA: hypothetical protein PK156_24755, partial [Polyangium sp.]|nr:hypothetical protein [Polyangium sp.]
LLILIRRMGFTVRFLYVLSLLPPHPGFSWRTDNVRLRERKWLRATAYRESTTLSAKRISLIRQILL